LKDKNKSPKVFKSEINKIEKILIKEPLKHFLLIKITYFSLSAERARE